MNVPRLTEVFVLREANVTSLAQMNKIPLSVAQKINEFDRQWAPQLASIFAGRYVHEGMPEASILDDATRFLDLFGEKMVHFLKKNQAKKQQFVDLSKKDWRTFLRQVINSWNDKGLEDLSKRAEITFPDGSYWVKLKDDECDIEGKMMQHCGSGAGDMYSLRDKEGKPHVTADIRPASSGKRALVGQLRGKQNSMPDKKYWRYVLQFFKHFDAVLGDDYYNEVGGAKHNEFVDFLDSGLGRSSSWRAGE